MSSTNWGILRASEMALRLKMKPWMDEWLGGQWFGSRLAVGQSHAESFSANVARENAPGGEYFNARHQRRAKRVRCMPLSGCNRSFLFNRGLNIV